MNKMCKCCKIEFPTSNFYSHIKKEKENEYKYFDAICKDCRSKYSSKRKRKNKEKAIMLLGGKCADCEVEDECIDIYDFHHENDDKLFAIANKLNLRFSTIENEIRKCVLLCANCHRKRHSVPQ